MSKSKFFLPCEDIGTICDKAQYNEATLLEKIHHTIHLLYCKACSKYYKYNSKLTKKVNKSKATCLEKEAKDAIRTSFHEALKKIDQDT